MKPALFRPTATALAMRTAASLVVGLGAALLVEPARAQAPQPAPPAPASPPAPSTPTLRPGASLHLIVVGAPDLTGDYMVDPAGDITLLYVGAVHVGGLSAPQVAKRLASEGELGKYYRRPQVLATQTSVGGVGVEVTGAVTTQGTHVMRADARLNDLLQPAGPAEDADLARVQVTHGLPDRPHTMDTVDYRSFLDRQAAAGNPALADGDVVFVPRKQDVPIMVTLRGEVGKPGQLRLAADSTAYDAIQAAGGPLADADRTGIALRHAAGGPETSVSYDAAIRHQSDPAVNPALRDGDTLVVGAAAIANTYTISGAVLKPGEYPLDRPGLTLADALGRAGGLASYAKKKELTVLRRTANGGRTPLKLDVSDPTAAAAAALQPGDIISVPQGGPGTHVDPLQALGLYGTLSSVFGGR